MMIRWTVCMLVIAYAIHTYAPREFGELLAGSSIERALDAMARAR